MNEVEKFLEGTEPNKTVDVLEASLIPEDGSAKTESTDEGQGNEGGDDAGERPRNRRERRLMTQRDNEAKSAAFLAGKLEAITEGRKTVEEEADYLKIAERIYGNDSPEAALATDLLKKAITGARDDAENRAYSRIKAERDEETQQVQAAETELDSMIDEIEDTYGVELNEPQERAYFQLLEKMSPKDKDGNVREYADPHSVFEIFRDTILKKPTETSSRAKDLSSRSMVKSGTSTELKTGDDAMARYLHEQGLI